MSLQSIDFTISAPRIIISPSVLLQALQLYCRNNTNIQCTLLGKIYSTQIQVLELVPIQFITNDKVSGITTQQHSKLIQKVTSVYPSFMILGGIITNMIDSINLAHLHQIYNNKEQNSGFKPYGILQFPLMLVLNTNFLSIDCYIYDATYKPLKEVVNTAGFLKLVPSVAFSDNDNVLPLLQAYNDNEVIVPSSMQQKIKSLASNLSQLSVEKHGVELRKVVDLLNTKKEKGSGLLNYLVTAAGVHTQAMLKFAQE